MSLLLISSLAVPEIHGLSVSLCARVGILMSGDAAASTLVGSVKEIRLIVTSDGDHQDLWNGVHWQAVQYRVAVMILDKRPRLDQRDAIVRRPFAKDQQKGLGFPRFRTRWRTDFQEVPCGS